MNHLESAAARRTRERDEKEAAWLEACDEEACRLWHMKQALRESQPAEVFKALFVAMTRGDDVEVSTVSEVINERFENNRIREAG